MAPVNRGVRLAVALFFGGVAVILHIAGYARPDLIVGWSRLPAYLLTAALLAGMYVLPRIIPVPGNYWKNDRLMQWGIALISTLLGIETILFLAVAFDWVRELIPFVQVSPHSSAEASRFYHLMAFSLCLGSYFPYILTALRSESTAGKTRKTGANLPRQS